MSFVPEPLPSTPCTLQQAIGRQEGWYLHGSQLCVCQRNCNPGNIIASEFATEHGATDVAGRFAVFPDNKTGWAALTALLKTPSYANGTVQEAVYKWAPPSDNNETDQYLTNVLRWTGLSSDTPIAQVLGSQT